MFKKLIVIFTLLFPVHASKVCFKKRNSPNKVKRTFSDLLLKNESILVLKSSNCVLLDMSEERINLFKDMMNKSFAIVSRSTSSRMCRMKLKEVEKKKLENSKVNIGKKIFFTHESNKNFKTTIRSLLSVEGRASRISVNNEDLYIRCKILPNHYELTFSLTNLFNIQFSSTVNLSRDRWLNVGQISRDLGSKKRGVSINSGLKYQNTADLEVKDYFLSVE